MHQDASAASESLPANARLLVFGYLGGRNFGDELMLLGLIEEAQRSGVSDIRIVTPNGEPPPHLADKVSGAYPKSTAGLIAGLRWSNTFAVCGGTVFHDAFDDSRYRNYRKTLISNAFLCATARLLGNRVFLIGIGVGPLRRWLTKATLRLAIHSADSISVRDAPSLAELVALDGSGKAFVRRDLALSATPDFPAPRPSLPRRILLSSVSASNTSVASTEQAQAFLDTLAEGLARFLSVHTGWHLSVLEVAVGQYDNDTAVAADMANVLAKAVPDRVEKLRFEGDPHHFLTAIGSAAVVIGSRYHIATAAELIGVPTYWVPYQRKVVDAARESGVPETRMSLPLPENVQGVLNWLEETAAKLD